MESDSSQKLVQDWVISFPPADLITDTNELNLSRTGSVTADLFLPLQVLPLEILNKT